MADPDTMALLAAAVAKSRLHTLSEIAAAPPDDAVWVQHYGDVGQSVDDGLWHFHRIPRGQIDPLVEAAYGIPSLADAHPDSVESVIGDVIAESADGALAAEVAWQAFLDRLTDAIRDYEIRLGIAGLILERDAPWTIGPVTFTQAEGGDDAVATVTRRGCPQMAIVLAEVVIELACDLLRALASDAEASHPPLSDGAIRLNEYLPPRYRLGVGEQCSRRREADGVNGMSDPTGRDLPISEVWPFDGRLGDWTPEHRSVIVPARWPAARSRSERLLKTVPALS